MAEWLKEVIETVNREFDLLPDWEKNSSDETCRCSSDDDERPATTVQEPRSD